MGWNDYGARHYDALLGRWMGVDELAEEQVSFTPYHYVYDNPMLLTDPNGRWPDGEGPTPPSAAGIMYEAYKQADAATFNFMMRGVEWAGYGKPGFETRKVVEYDDYGGVYVHPNKIVESPNGSESKWAVAGDLLALAPVMPLGKILGPASKVTGVLRAETPGVKNVVVKSLKDVSFDIIKNVKKAINGDLPHAITQGTKRGVFNSALEAKNMLKDLSKNISKNGFSSNAFKDGSYVDRVLVPVGNGGLASYQVAKNGTASLKTVLNVR